MIRDGKFSGDGGGNDSVLESSGGCGNNCAKVVRGIKTLKLLIFTDQETAIECILSLS